MSKSRQGFTVIEVLVSMAILGLLVAVLLPAVQQSRESARRIQCRNNLKQFGIAIADFQSSQGVFPTGTVKAGTVQSENAMWRLLPSLGYPDVRAELITTFNSGIPPTHLPVCAIPLFKCPSDTLHVGSYGNSNYLMNDGTKFRDYERTNGYRQTMLRDTRPGDVTDGMSQTAAMAERLVVLNGLTEAQMQQDAKRYLWFTQTRYSAATQTLLAVKECRENRTTPFPQYVVAGMSFYQDNHMGYDHLMLPNEVGCYNGPEDFSTNNYYLIPANSQHVGGVHMLLLDGSVHFVSDHIDETVWRAIGTINGQESVSTGF